MSGPNNLEPSRSPVDNATITMDAHETLVRQSPSAVRRVPFQHLGFETFRPGFTALQFNISGTNQSSAGPSDALQPRLGSRHQSHGENQRQQQQGQPDTVPLPAELPHLRDDSSSDSDSEDEAPYMQLTLRPPTPRPAPAIDSDNDLPSLFTVSDSSDNAQDQSDDDDEDWTDEDEDDSTMPEPSDPRSAPFLFGGDNVPSGDPMDVWQALIGSMPTERPPDPERAKELIHGLEAIPDDLLDRWFAAAGENADVMCAICRDDLADPSATRSSEKDAVSRLLALSCRHVFHSECLAPWLARRTTCPTCRFDIDPDSLTLRQPPQPAMSSSDQITQLLAPFMPQRRQVDGSAAPGTAAVDPAQFDYAERLRQLISESEDTPPTSPLDTNAWQHSLRTFIMLGYEIEVRLRAHGDAIDEESRAELDEERRVYAHVEDLVRRGLDEVLRMVDNGETFDPSEFLDGVYSDDDSIDDADEEDEDEDADSLDASEEEEFEMPPLERVSDANLPTVVASNDDESIPPLEPLTPDPPAPPSVGPRWNSFSFFGNNGASGSGSAIQLPAVPTITEPIPDGPTTIIPPPGRTGFWRQWRRDARLAFQMLYDIGRTTDTNDARQVLGDLDERAQLIFRATTLPVVAVSRHSSAEELLDRALRGEILDAREMDAARRADTRMFAERLATHIWGIGDAEATAIEDVYVARRDRLHFLSPSPSGQPVPTEVELDDLQAFRAELERAIATDHPTREIIINGAHCAYRERRRVHRPVVPPTSLQSPPVTLHPLLGSPLTHPTLLDDPRMQLFQQLVGPLLTQATTTPSSPPAALNIPSPMIPALIAPVVSGPAPAFTAEIGDAHGAAQQPERRKWMRPEAQSLLEWVEEREIKTGTRTSSVGEAV